MHKNEKKKRYNYWNIPLLSGFIVSFIFSFFNAPVYINWILGVIGLIIGSMNIKDHHLNNFLIASIAFILASSVVTGTFSDLVVLKSFLNNIKIIVGTATVMVTIKILYDTCKK